MFVTELYEEHHGLSPGLMNDNFRKEDVTYNFENNFTFEIRNILKSFYYGSDKISFLGPKIWELLPSNIEA